MQAQQKKSQTRQKKFRKQNPDYFKNYYLANIEKFKQRNRQCKSNRKYYYIVEIKGNKYCFTNKNSIPIKRVKIEDVNNIPDIQHISTSL